MADLSIADWRAVLTVVGETGELSSSPEQACTHFMSRVAALIGSGPVWWSVIGGSGTGVGQPDDGVAEVTSSRVHGLDPHTLRRWEQSYLETRAYGEHPTWERAFATPGVARCFLRRDIVCDHDWYSSPHVMEYSRSFDADDLVAAIVPIGGGAELCVAGMRGWGDTGFTAREREILLLLAQHTAWLAQRPDPLASLARSRPGAAVTIAPTNLGVVRGTGPAPDGTFADPRHAALGWRAYGKMPEGPRATDWDALRVAHCIPESGIELVPGDSYILECGFERLNGVDFRKGCYVGQEVTARMKHKTELRKGLVTVNLAAPVPVGTPVLAGGKPVGTVYTQSGGRGIAYLRLDRVESGLTAGGVTVTMTPPSA